MPRKFLLTKKPKTKIIVVGSILTTLSLPALTVGCSESDKEETSKLQTKSKRKIRVNFLNKSLFNVTYSNVSHSSGEKYKILLEKIANSSATQKLKIEVSVNNSPFNIALENRRSLLVFHKKLLDSDQVRVRFLVADQYKKTHTLPKDFSNIITFTVSDFKKEVDTTYLKKDSYEKNVDGPADSPNFTITQKSGATIQFEVIPLYAIQKQSSSTISEYTKNLPTNIERGDTIYMKFAIRDGAYAKFPASFTNTPFQFTI